MANDKLSVNEEHFIETQKVVFDYIKYLTSLNTGSIILLTVLIEKFFNGVQEWRILIGITFCSFLLSILSLTLSALGIIRSMRTPADVSKWVVLFTSWTFIFGIVCFICGITCISLFSIKNWF